MLKELKFVQGAVGKKEFIPAITHFCIENGTVRAYNGTIALSSPIPCDISCKPKAVPMVQAIGKCRDTITMHMTPTGKLSIRSGSFKALIDCIDEAQVHVQPEGQFIEFDGEKVLKALKVIEPFISSDAATGREWSTGVLLKGQSAYATNNVCIIEYWVGANFPLVVNVPRLAVIEMLRIGEPPVNAQVTSNSITFHYDDGKWVRSQLLNTQWPDINRILDVQSDQKPIPQELFTGLDALKPFMNKFGEVYITSEYMRTHADPNEGSSFDLDFFPGDSMYALEMLQKLEGVATHADFGLYPSPAPFYGDNLRGAIIGRKM